MEVSGPFLVRFVTSPVDRFHTAEGGRGSGGQIGVFGLLTSPVQSCQLLQSRRSMLLTSSHCYAATLT